MANFAWCWEFVLQMIVCNHLMSNNFCRDNAPSRCAVGCKQRELVFHGQFCEAIRKKMNEVRKESLSYVKIHVQKKYLRQSGSCNLIQVEFLRSVLLLFQWLYQGGRATCFKIQTEAPSSDPNIKCYFNSDDYTSGKQWSGQVTYWIPPSYQALWSLLLQMPCKWWRQWVNNRKTNHNSVKLRTCLKKHGAI